MPTEQPKKGKFLERLAEENGVAVVVLDENGKEHASANNNSICASLYTSPEFAPKCAEFCGKAFERTSDGSIYNYECHAGLTCRAVSVEDGGQRFVTIVGRTFQKAENYRKATEKAISGEWNQFRPTDFFENVLMSGSAAGIEKAAKRLSKFAPQSRNDILELDPIKQSVEQVSAKPVEPHSDELSRMVERFNSETAAETPIAKPKPATRRDPESDVMAMRSLFGSLMKLEYRDACASILDFVQSRYNFTSLIWLERRDNVLEAVLTRGSLAGKAIRLNLPADTPRLIDAANKETALVLRERSKGDNAGDGRTLSVFPAKVGNDVRGGLAVEGKIEEKRKVRELARFSKSIGPQVEILRLRDEVSSRDWVAQALRHFNDSLRKIDADDFWMHVTQASAELMRAERASLLVRNERSGSLDAMASIGAAIDLRSAGDIGDRIARRVLERGDPVMVPDMGIIGIEFAPEDRRYRSSSFISFPIMMGDRRLAVMNFTDRAGGDAFNKRDLELLQTIAPQIAMAIDRTSLKDKAGEFEQLSLTDALTGLLNRRYIEERLTEEMNRAKRHHFPMSVMMIDVDHFKSYNDSYGHPAGDLALRMVANVLKETLRGADVAARYGGEEFAILLPQTPGDEAAAIAERIRQRVERTEFPKRPITISVGIAGYSSEFETTKDWVTAADMALYEAKHHGRNNVQLYDNMGRSFREKIH